MANIKSFKAISYIILNFVFVLPHNATECNYNQFKCHNGECIFASYQCDGGRDCTDNSDEEHCHCTSGPSCYHPPTTPVPVCNEHQFQCSSGECIPLQWHCDDEFDCRDRSDENNCQTIPCQQYQFTCDNNACIDTKLKCNGKNDCGDDSDESICHIHPSSDSTINITDCGDAFHCIDGTCIDNNKVCNHTPDCPDNSDESLLCMTSCEGLPCDISSKHTPTGCVCTCPPGYRLGGDGLTCVDLLECAHNPSVCSQLCTEVKGSFACSCFKEFTMRHDNVSCKSTGQPMAVYFAVRNEIRYYLPAKRNLQIVHTEEEEDVLFNTFDLNIKSRWLLYSKTRNSSLLLLNLHNKSYKSISNVGDIQHISLDWLTQNIYVVTKEIEEDECADSHRLKVCNMSDRKCARLLETTITALAVDPMSKLVFYSTVFLNSNDEEISSLVRVGMDGKFNKTLVNFNDAIKSIAIDYRRKHIYIGRQSSIDRLDYDGGQLLNILETSMVIKGLSIFEDQLFFVADGGFTMYRCHLYGDTRRCTSFRLSAEATEMFVIDQETLQTPGRNACVNHNCKYLCVPTNYGATCICENGKHANEQSDCKEDRI